MKKLKWENLQTIEFLCYQMLKKKFALTKSNYDQNMTNLPIFMK